MTYQQKIAALRHEMKTHQVDAYLIPSSDPHISEYLPDRYKSIEWLSGFTGSAGTLVITADFAGLWTDSRYFVQANEQLANSGFELVKLKVQGAPEYADWMVEHLKAGAIVAFDGKSASQYLADILIQSVKATGISVRGDLDLLDIIWKDRPALPTAQAYLLSSEETGQGTSEKIASIRQQMKKQGAEYHVISSLDDLAWALNIRGSDVSCNPVVLGFLLISMSSAKLYIDLTKLSSEAVNELESAGIETHEYENVWEALATLPEGAKLLIDPKRTCHTLFTKAPSTVIRIGTINPSANFKALKNEVEIQFTRETMIQDGVALTRFFRWLETEITGSQAQTEISIAEKLRDFRAEQEGFVGESFDTIAGYLEHGALPHYKATEASNGHLQPHGLLLIDSGGQYRTGTTDITRTVWIGPGEPSAEIRDRYTRVLKGHIAFAVVRFPAGTTGHQLDALARLPLWMAGLDYDHGTGHGVGSYLGVHEGPQRIAKTPNSQPLLAGMIVSNEPGYYKPGHWGIRIENLQVVTPAEPIPGGERPMHRFEALTMAPLDRRLIETDLLTPDERAYVDGYHATVLDKVGPLVDGAARAWLERACAPL